MISPSQQHIQELAQKVADLFTGEDVVLFLEVLAQLYCTVATERNLRPVARYGLTVMQGILQDAEPENTVH